MNGLSVPVLLIKDDKGSYSRVLRWGCPIWSCRQKSLFLTTLISWSWQTNLRLSFPSTEVHFLIISLKVSLILTEPSTSRCQHPQSIWLCLKGNDAIMGNVPFKKRNANKSWAVIFVCLCCSFLMVRTLTQAFCQSTTLEGMTHLCFWTGLWQVCQVLMFLNTAVSPMWWILNDVRGLVLRTRRILCPTHAPTREEN